MKKILNYMKNHKFTTLVIVLYIAFIILLAIVINTMSLKRGEVVYGNRLDPIKNVKFDEDSVEKKVKEEYKKKKGVKKVSLDRTVKTINFKMVVEDNVKVEDAKKMAVEILKFLSDDVKKTHSINIFVEKENDKIKNFPIEAYKHFNSKGFSWTKDR